MITEILKQKVYDCTHRMTSRIMLHHFQSHHLIIGQKSLNANDNYVSKYVSCLQTTYSHFGYSTVSIYCRQLAMMTSFSSSFPLQYYPCMVISIY